LNALISSGLGSTIGGAAAAGAEDAAGATEG